MYRSPRIWGATVAEIASSYPCDRFMADPNAELHRAIDVAAPADVLFRWLCQIRIAPYSYDWLDNLGRPSPRHLVSDPEPLRLGQRAIHIFSIVDFESERSLTIRITDPLGRAVWGDHVVSYVLTPRAGDGSRLSVKLAVRYPARPPFSAMRWLFPWIDFFMMRRQLLNLKRLAEAQRGSVGRDR
jgi:hypothetical protein